MKQIPHAVLMVAAATLIACGEQPDRQPAQATPPADRAQPARPAPVATAPTAQPTGTFQLAGDAERGQRIYAAQCASCHGVQGRGDGPAGRALRPPATDFTAATEMTPERAYLAVRDGGMAVGLAPTMPPFNRMLSDQDIHDVVAYLMQLREGA